MDIQKLKPCPFCGGTNLSFDTDTVHPDNIHMAWVECNGGECECRGPRAFWFDDMSEAKTNAAELWNNRAAPPAPVDLAALVPEAYELIAEAWRLMDGQNPATAEWHSAASRYLNAHRAEMLRRIQGGKC